tara:strand:+ start:259 stop:717 length:459 start_codon:yes stop_codon:yes gene_type:complete
MARQNNRGEITMKKQMTKLELLQDTIRYYSENPEGKRALENVFDAEENHCGSDCVYTTENGQHCAVGRFLKKEHQSTEFQYNEENSIIDILDYMSPEELFVEEVQDIPQWLWTSLQGLHDIDGNWGEKGLTQQGEERAEKIYQKIIKSEGEK